MKRIAFISLFLTLLGIFAAPEVRAHSSRVVSMCSICHQPVYAYYRPVSYHGVVRYTWVTAYHSHSTRYRSPYYRVPPRPVYGYPPSRYVRPGFSITITR